MERTVVDLMKPNFIWKQFYDLGIRYVYMNPLQSGKRICTRHSLCAEHADTIRKLSSKPEQQSLLAAGKGGGKRLDYVGKNFIMAIVVLFIKNDGIR